MSNASLGSETGGVVTGVDAVNAQSARVAQEQGGAGDAGSGFLEDVVGVEYGEPVYGDPGVSAEAKGALAWEGGPENPSDGAMANNAVAPASAGTALSLADLVPDADAEGGSLTSFLHFTFDAQSNSTIVNVSATGNVATEVDQQIVLAGVGDLTGNGGNSDLSIVANLLSGQWHADA